MKRPRRRWALALVLGVALVLTFAWYHDGRFGHRVAAARTLQHEHDFDFRSPPCAPTPYTRIADTDVRLAYLGVGGILIEWRGAMLATSPYFTNQGLLAVNFGKLRVDTAAIARGVQEFSPTRWDVLLSGHSHYDHLADLPELMTRHATHARLWTNTSGARMLDAFETLQGRVEVIEQTSPRWIRPRDRDGAALPFRFAPVASDHSPHLHGYRFAPGKVTESWNSWDRRRVSAMRQGQTWNFLIDLLDENDQIAYRIFFQDAVSSAGMGSPPADWIADRPVDLAVLCVPPYWEVDDYPRGILAATLARHALTIHYEDFMRAPEHGLRFVQSLTDARVDRFLERLEQTPTLTGNGAPSSAVCGPAGAGWTMPLPGEWLGFQKHQGVVLTSPVR